MSDELPDVQRTLDGRGIPIDEVGVSHIRYPITLPMEGGSQQQTVAEVSMTVGLPGSVKGTHMSRFMRILNRCEDEGNCEPWAAPTTPKRILPRLCTDLEATRAQVRFRFPYFLKTSAPETGLVGLIDYDCWVAGAILHVNKDSFHYVLEAGVDVPVATLCPCSKEISEYGAHNQRGYVRLAIGKQYIADVESSWWQDYLDSDDIELPWFEDMIASIEDSASCRLYPVLKRPDEKRVTEAAYDNPKFVEDVVRDVAGQYQDLVGPPPSPYQWVHVRSVNHESIHTHNAVARVMLGEPSTLIHEWL